MRIFITGAASGIGAAIVRQALSDGHQVIACDANKHVLTEQWGDDAQTYSFDVRDADAWQSVWTQAEQDGGAIDVLINVAGVLRTGATGELAADDVQLMMDVNVNGVIYGTNVASQTMRARGAGHIINIGSLASLYAVPGLTVYAASKFAVRGFSLAAAADLLPHNVAVTVVGPGAVKTAMLDQQRDDPNAALTFSSARALSAEEVAVTVMGHVLSKRPLDCYLPASQGWQGKISNVFPKLMFGQLDKLRKKGAAQYHAKDFS